MEMQNIQTSKGKNKFTYEEDLIISWFVREHGPNFMNIQLFVPNRTAKQCREKWKNYLDPTIKQEAFSREENTLLIEKYFEKKGKWSLIAKFFNGRTDVKLKNQFDYLKRNQYIDFNQEKLFLQNSLNPNYNEKEESKFLNRLFDSSHNSTKGLFRKTNVIPPQITVNECNQSFRPQKISKIFSILI
jgi:hypothetical protein